MTLPLGSKKNVLSFFLYQVSEEKLDKSLGNVYNSQYDIVNLLVCIINKTWIMKKMLFLFDFGLRNLIGNKLSFL